MWSVGLAVLAACGGGQDPAPKGTGNGQTGTATAGGPSPTASDSSRFPPPAGGGHPPGSQHVKSRKTVLIVGTSLTAGLGLDPEEAYPALLQQKVDSVGLHYDVVNAGLSGETSAGALRRIDWLMRGPADVVIIETGANDGLRGLNVDSTRANLRAIIAKVKAARPAARILLAQMEAPPNLGTKYTDAFRAMYQDVAKETQVSVMAFLLEGVAGVTRLNQGDGIHPNEEGEQIVANNVWRALEPILRELDAVSSTG